MIKLISRFAGTFQLLFVVAVVGSAILLSVALKPEQTAAYPSAVTQTLPVSVVQPAVSNYRPTVSLNGVVEARTVTDVIPQVSGRVVEVAPEFRAGARVSKGGLLFRIDPSDYQLAIERTLAEIEAARSELALLEAQSTAEKQVWNQQFPDRKIPDLIAKVPQIAAAKARIHSAEAARQVAELSLRRTVVRSPFDARVLNTRLEVGQVINTGNNVGSVFSVDSLEIAVPVSLEQLALIGDAIGQDARITRVGNADLALSGAVVRQAAALNETTRLGTLYVAAEESEALMLGEFVGVQIEGNDTPQALSVPAASLTSRDQVWVVSNGVLETRRIEILGSDNEITVVRDFDVADGIVAVPPADGRVGLPVTVQMDSGLAAAGAGAGNVAE